MKLSAPHTDTGKLQRAALDLLREHAERGELPTSVRFLFYELEQRGIVSMVKPKVQPRARRARAVPDQGLIDAVRRMRDIGAIPWNWIVDDTRMLHQWRCAASVAAYLTESVSLARIDPWHQTVRPVILTESRTIGGVFARGVARQYLCPVAATNGQAGGFLVTNIAPLLANDATRALYVGDFDLSGGQIEDNTRRVLERHTGRSFDDDTWERVAVTAAQAIGLRAQGMTPIVKDDERYRPPHQHEAYEVEALTQAVAVSLLRARLDELMPEPLDDVLERQAQQRERIEAVLRGLDDE